LKSLLKLTVSLNDSLALFTRNYFNEMTVMKGNSLF
jgi:hypothetical protein